MTVGVFEEHDINSASHRAAIERRSGTGSRRDADVHAAWLLQTTNRMLICGSVAELLDVAYTAIREGLGYDRVGLFLVDQDARTLVERCGTDEQGRRTNPEDRVFPLTAESPLRHVPGLGELLAGADYFHTENLTSAFVQAAISAEGLGYLDGQPASNLMVALRSADTFWGLIAVDNLLTGRPVTERDAPLLQSFATALTSAVEKASAMERLTADLQRRVEQLTWLQATAAQLTGATDREGVLTILHDSIHAGLNYDRVSIWVIDTDPTGQVHLRRARADDDRNHLVADYPMVAAFSLDDPRVAEWSPALMQLIAGADFYLYEDRWLETLPEHHALFDRPVREQLVVALRHDGQFVGTITVDNSASGRAITRDDATPLVAMAAQAGLALGRIELWHEQARRVAELEWLRETGRRVNAARSLNEMLETVYDGIREGLGYDRAAIFLFDHAASTAEQRFGTDNLGQKTQPTERRYTLGPQSDVWRFAGISAILQGAEFYYSQDVVSETPSDLLTKLDGTPRHNLAVPLRAGDVVVGMIAVDNLLTGRAIAPGEARLLQALGNQVGTAVDNARLRERVLTEMARGLSLGHDMPTMMKTAAQEIADVLNSWCVVTLGTEFSAENSTVAHYDPARIDALTHFLAGRGVPISMESTVSRAMAEGHSVKATISTEGIAALEARSDLVGDMARLLQMPPHQVMVVPLQDDGEAIGNIFIVREQFNRPFTTEEETLAQLVAQRVTAGVATARLYAQTEGERARLRAVLDAMADAVLLFDSQGNLVELSPSGRRIFGLVGEQFRTLPGTSNPFNLVMCYADGTEIPPSELPSAVALRGETLTNRQLAVTLLDGRVVDFSAAAAPIRRHNVVIGAVVVLRDTSAERTLERMKDEFIAIASHELTTPLTAVRGYVELVAMRLQANKQATDSAPVSTDRSQQHLATVLDQVDRLIALVGDMMDLSRIQSGQLAMTRQPIDLCALVRRIRESLGLTTARQRLVLSGADGALRVDADPHRIEQVLDNLISNALKYSPQDSDVLIDVQRVETEVIVSVRDHGPGIPPQHRDRLFDRFYRVSSASGTRVGGLGLGLYVSHTIATQHGGRLWLGQSDDSAADISQRGSTFCLALPLRD